VRRKIRVLLEKSVRTHEENLAMMERLGVQNEWRDKSKQAYSKIQRLLDPSYRPDSADFAPSDASREIRISPSGPAIPQAPGSRSGGPTDPTAPNRENDDRGPKTRPSEGPIRQIM
jgi:hypothetical protein